MSKLLAVIRDALTICPLPGSPVVELETRTIGTPVKAVVKLIVNVKILKVCQPKATLHPPKTPNTHWEDLRYVVKRIKEYLNNGVCWI